jgi:murein DD-endopeptidase MepM/ murein hydrolase activator NlpD
VKIKGDVKPIMDEKCKDQTWHDPIDNPQLANYTKGGGKAPYWNVFGTVRTQKDKKTGKMKAKIHQGVDLLAMPGTPIYACVDSIISMSGNLKPSHKGGANYGYYLLLKAKCSDFVTSQKKAYSMPYFKQGEMEKEPGFSDNGDLYFFYAHLLEFDPAIQQALNNGERVEVKAGQVIGKTGTSGYDTSADPHLHFEISSKPFTNRINPGFYIKYKLPNDLTFDENANQAKIAKKQWGDPSPEK